ncbi:MAG TPA: amidohydrolase, partial [Arthrobacter sp.]|nr:amidohydrolase [Arthrobacter sp.]
QVFPHVYLDVGLVSHYLGPSAGTAIRQAMEIAPFSKILYSSDAYGLGEHYAVSAASWRSAFAALMDEWVASGWATQHDAERIATMVTSKNARRVYNLNRQSPTT